MSKKHKITDTVTVTFPFRVSKHGGRKEVQLPAGANNRSPDYTLVKAVARAFRWRQIFEEGDMGTSPTWRTTRVSRHHIIRARCALTLLAPDVIEAILDGNRPSVGMAELLDLMTHVWAKHRSALGNNGK